MDGTLQGDGNTVFVTSVLDFATFNGTPGPALPVILSSSGFIGVPGIQPTLSLDGSIMDFYAATPGGIDGFAFVPAGLIGGVAMYSAGSSFGGSVDDYNSANWIMSPAATAVPELDAAGAPLAFVWLAGVLALSRRKAA